jgi:hypothetical protein
MTERERFIAWAESMNLDTHVEDGGNLYASINTQIAWEGWKARADVGAGDVPMFCNVAQRKLDQLLADGYRVTGYALTKDDKYCYADCFGLVLWPKLESWHNNNISKGDSK